MRRSLQIVFDKKSSNIKNAIKKRKTNKKVSKLFLNKKKPTNKKKKKLTFEIKRRFKRKSQKRY